MRKRKAGPTADVPSTGRRNPEPLSSAERCRRNGWQVGDVLQSGEYEIRITAIGEQAVLFRHLKPAAFAGTDETISHCLPERWEQVDDEALFKLKEDKYDGIPLKYFSDDTKVQGKLSVVINRACKMAGQPRERDEDGWRFCNMNPDDVRYYVEKAEFSLGLRKDEPNSSGDNEYG
jgi:hypothetical protein